MLSSQAEAEHLFLHLFLHLMQTSMDVLGWVHVAGQAPRCQAFTIGKLAIKTFDAFYNNIYSP